MSKSVLVEDFEVLPRLFELHLPKEVLVDVLDRAAGERANVNESDPIATAGIEMRRWCTRYLRDDPRLRDLGWVPCRHDKVDGIRNDDLRIKIAYMNTDGRTGMISKQPRSIAEKGPVAERLVQNNLDAHQGILFEVPSDSEPDPISEYDFWYLCGYVSEKHIAAELSRPIGITNCIVDDFSERLILWQPGDKDGIRTPNDIPEEYAEVEKPAVIRRR